MGFYIYVAIGFLVTLAFLYYLSITETKAEINMPFIIVLTPAILFLWPMAALVLFLKMRGENQ